MVANYIEFTYVDRVWLVVSLYNSEKKRREWFSLCILNTCMPGKLYLIL